MPDLYQRRILKHLADTRYQPRTVMQLAAELGVPDDQFQAFARSVEELNQEGQVVLGDSREVVLPPPGREITGVFRKHERGFGFVIPDEATAHGDLFIPPNNTLDALTGDRVRAKVRREPRRGGAGQSPYTGRIVEVLARCEQQYVGTLAKRGRHFVVQADGRSLHDPILIRDATAKNARVGDKVAVELVTYPQGDGELPEGVITEVLGEAGEPEVETLAVMRGFGLAEQFPPEALQEAREAARKISDHVPPDREDLTPTFICTIDPPDAKDYDDAISIQRLDGASDAAWELGVHIADVAHFVEPGSALDEEAYARGNSTYLPRKVVPMLPEVLSNGVCSLQEGVNRYAKSCFLRYDAQGRVVGQRFARTVIRSAKRLTYLEAQALIDGDLREARKHAKTEPKYPKQLVRTLQLMNELARTIRQRRLADGMIVLGLPEVELIYDDSGRVVDAEPEDDAFTHKIIEMFMVEANEAAARLFDRLDIPMIRRVHADPDAYNVGELRGFARVAGYNIPARPSRHEIQQLLDAVRGKPAQYAVHMAVLKTLSKAEYAPALLGHFALASEHYTHFTSPIRRYPDFVVHRGINAILDADARGLKSPGFKRKVKDDPRLPDEDRLREIGRHCSNTERNSEAAERELRSYLVLELLTNHLGEDFPGTVTGVTGSGIYVQIDKFLIDGFIRTPELPPAGERWRLNPNTGALVAQRSGRAITIGDRFTVRIAQIDLARRQMDLVILEESKTEKPKIKQKQKTKKNRNKPRKNGASPKVKKLKHGKRRRR